MNLLINIPDDFQEAFINDRYLLWSAKCTNCNNRHESNENVGRLPFNPWVYKYFDMTKKKEEDKNEG